MSNLVVEFSATTQSLGALREAAYRLIGRASCRIEQAGDVYRCILEPQPANRLSEAELRAGFVDLVTDENLREKLRAETGPVRNLILALAFGAFAREDSTQADS